MTWIGVDAVHCHIYKRVSCPQWVIIGSYHPTVRWQGRTDIVTVCPGHAPRYHDDVIKWKHFPRYWPFVRGIHRSPVSSPHKGQWRGALMFSLICVWINGWVNNREAGDLRRNRAHNDVSVMITYGTASTELHEHEPSTTADMNQSTNLLNVISDSNSMAWCQGICFQNVRKHLPCCETST